MSDVDFRAVILLASWRKAGLGVRVGAGGPAMASLQLPRREMVMAWSHELRLEEIRSGRFRATLKLWGQYLPMDLDVRAREEACLDLPAQTSTTTD